jgi:hypothetical protein
MNLWGLAITRLRRPMSVAPLAATDANISDRDRVRLLAEASDEPPARETASPLLGPSTASLGGLRFALRVESSTEPERLSWPPRQP